MARFLKGKGLLLMVIALATLLALPVSTVAGGNNAVKADPILIWINHGDEYIEDVAYKEGVAITFRILIIETYSGYGVLCASAWDSEPNTMFVRILKGGSEVAYDEATSSPGAIDVAYAEWPFHTFAFLTVQVGYTAGSFPAYFSVSLLLEIRG